MSEDEIQKLTDYAMGHAGVLGLTDERGWTSTKKVCAWVIASGQFISVKELREKIEKKLRVLITHEVSKCDRCRSYNNALDDFRVLLDEMSKLPKSQEKIET